MRILLSTEGTYPYTRGGVSTWADALVRGLPEHEFAVVAIVANPHVAMRYELPGNVRLSSIPLWGAERVDEYLPRRGAVGMAARTTRAAIGQGFLPLVDRLVRELLVADADAAVIGECISALAEFCGSYDLRRALRDERVWDIVVSRMRDHPLFRHRSIGGATELARSLYRYLMPLALAVPGVDVAHSSAAAICALPALVAKLRDGVPLVVSEHGIYLRERILDLVRNESSTIRKVLFGNLYRGVAQAVYRHADRVVPVCAYNTVWERQLRVDPAKLRIIHNGVAAERFSHSEPATPRPTVAFVGRIDPLKDVLGLIAAAATVREAVPQVRFRLYGSDGDETYARRCRAATLAAGLGDVVRFEGPTHDVAAAYRDADVVVLPSVSEGFPFTVVEAMMAARPVVATRVGGIPEALADPRLLVPPQSPAALAATLTAVLQMPPAQRRELGAQLRRRAVETFSERRFLEGYAALYGEMAARAS